MRRAARDASGLQSQRFEALELGLRRRRLFVGPDELGGLGKAVDVVEHPWVLVEPEVAQRPRDVPRAAPETEERVIRLGVVLLEPRACGRGVAGLPCDLVDERRANAIRDLAPGEVGAHDAPLAPR
jgi:hypothetical protein